MLARKLVNVLVFDLLLKPLFSRKTVYEGASMKKRFDVSSK